MRLLFVLALALLILPLSGCAKKKKDDSSSPAPAASNTSSSANYDANMGGAGHGMENPMMEEPMMGEHGEGSEITEEPTEDYNTPEVTSAEGENGNLDDMHANTPIEGSQNRNYFNQGAGGKGGHGQGQANNNTASSGGHGQGAGGYNPNGNAASGGHGQVKTANAPAAGSHGQGAGGYNSGNASGGGHGQARPANNAPSAGSHGQPGNKAPAAGGQGAGGNKLSQVAGQVVDWFTGGDSKPKSKAGSPGEGEAPVVEEEPSAEGEVGMAEVPADMNMSVEVEGGMGEGGMGEGGQPAQAPKKATDIPGVEEGSPEQAAVALILKVARGETEGLNELIAEDANGMLGNLRKGDEKAMAEAKVLMGRVRKNNSRLEDRDTVIYFENSKRQVLQFYVRKIQGEHVVREIRVRDAKPQRRRR